uniref:Uncharacterized protein n=1 Tax=Rhizophora mucronata TaxID=61149 RepID=A0A2P2PTP3_RHIMU
MSADAIRSVKDVFSIPHSPPPCQNNRSSEIKGKATKLYVGKTPITVS